MTAVVFDLDGTLIHSAPDIAAAANRLLAEHALEPLEDETITSLIGDGIPVLVERILALRPLPGPKAALVARFRALYEANSLTLTRPYPGVREVLAMLAADGCRLALCTNKPVGPARQILAGLGLEAVFRAIVGGDSQPERKPAPEPLLAAIAAAGGGPAVFVGDSEVDAACAASAGVPFLLFTGGYRRSPVEALPHAARFDTHSRLPDLIAAVGLGCNVPLR